MKTLLKNGTVVDVFTGELKKADVLLDGKRIVGVDDYSDYPADIVEDVSGKYICPGFIDGHIHIESTMLRPAEFARTTLPHGTTAVVSDPHEITNVCGISGLHYMLKASEKLPITVYVMLPSCVPATQFDESWENISAEKLALYFKHPRVLGLAEMMNYPGVLFGDKSVADKLEVARLMGKLIDGHAPLLSGRGLDQYISEGIHSDHECTSFAEAKERISKGQWMMIRQGTAARNLAAMLPLFDSQLSARCLLVTDDKEPSDLLMKGHIDSIIRQAVEAGKSPIVGIQMATLHAAQCFGLEGQGAVAPGYAADLLVLDDLDSVKIRDVYKSGVKVVENGVTVPFEEVEVDESTREDVYHSVRCVPVTENDLKVVPQPGRVRVINLIPNELLTDESLETLDFEINNGIDPERDILKLCVIERHKYTGHIGRGYIRGIGLKRGAIASTVSHDSHNIVVIGTNDADMALAVNRIREIGGGNVVVDGGRVIAEMALPIAGLMSDLPAQALAETCHAVRNVVYGMGVPAEIAPFMNMAFVSLPVIPHLKLTTLGLVDVDKFAQVPLFEEE